ncbi:hypothetical protein PPERSA_09344 [Pseudocohnilembus persalinus]|uniref:Papain family cysteine protease n=1 Tax=Pseudocohnilembus persalinus TaxID=266149 RepID=A0A0V0QYJ2_PSEPJ|nr:hypothetical protein PPERSA_09344 [Pseudocohnilembus persalinus]|eukprot:KRX07130.1 hypothetical protein PPERSA_09344 [Pseudocohnilembus persalinus]
MKTTLALTLLLAASSLFLFYSEKTPEQFNTNFSIYTNWKQSYGQVFSQIEESYRFSVFSENLEYINQHNLVEQDFKLALNQFAALPNEEFALRNTKKPVQSNLPLAKKTVTRTNVPDELNWATKGVVAPVQNQGNCGSCWAFGAVSQLETLNAIKNDQLIKFSEQQVTSCTGPAGFSSMGCDGGQEMDAFEYVAKYGIQTEESYPYVQQNDPYTAACKYDSDEVVFKNTGAERLQSNDPDAMISQLQEQTLSVGVSAGSLGFQFYSSGILTKNCNGYIDHAVSLTGYNKSNATPYFIVKNSWGSSWGQQGYVWIEITSGRGTCSINNDVSYPTLN